MLTDILLELRELFDVFAHQLVVSENAHAKVHLYNLTAVEDADHMLKHLHVEVRREVVTIACDINKLIDLSSTYVLELVEHLELQDLANLFHLLVRFIKTLHHRYEIKKALVVSLF